MKGKTFTVRGFELTDPHHLGFWTWGRDGHEVSVALADDITTQPAGLPFFARVAVDGADFGAGDGASIEDAAELAFQRADLGMQKIAARVKRDMGEVLDDARQAMQVIALDCATVVSPKLDDEERNDAAHRVERAVQRFDLAARILVGFARPGDEAAWRAARRDRTAEPAFLPSEPPPAVDDLAAHIAETDRLLDEAEAAVLALPSPPNLFIVDKDGMRPATDEDRARVYPRLFTVSEDPDDHRYTLAAMRAANPDDAHVLAWLDSAAVGETLDTMHGAAVTRVA